MNIVVAANDLLAQDAAAPRRRQRGWRSLAVCITVIVIIWGIVLPRLAQTPGVRTMIDRNQRLGIDPSAMYYSDLDHLEYRDSMLRRPRVDGPGSGREK